jgi:hypothetical protein
MKVSLTSNSAILLVHVAKPQVLSIAAIEVAEIRFLGAVTG